MNLTDLLKNPISLWIYSLINKLFYLLKNKNKALKFGYLSKVKNCFFGTHNVIHNRVTLRNCRFGNYNTCYSDSHITNATVGDFTYIASGNNINNISIGKFTSIGPEVLAGMGTHPSRKFISTHPAFFSTLHQVEISFVDKQYFKEFEPIKIGNDVWIGARVIILEGITIGDGAIIAAGAVVSKDVPDYAVVAGVPAKILRYRFETHEIERLKDIKWWDRDISWLKKNVAIFHDISKLSNLAD